MRYVVGTLVIALVLAAGFAAGVLYTPWEGKLAVDSSEQESSLWMRVVTLDEKATTYSVTGEYPEFRSLPEGLNQEIKRLISVHVGEFKANVAENQAARDELGSEDLGTSYVMHVTWDHQQLNRKYVSIVLYFSSYEGGAHGRDEIEVVNYDVVNERMVTLADLFPEDPAYLEHVATSAKLQLSDSLTASLGEAPADMIAAGTAPTIENFKRFTFTDDAVYLHFPRYQVAPGAAGNQQVVIPRDGFYE